MKWILYIETVGERYELKIVYKCIKSEIINPWNQKVISISRFQLCWKNNLIDGEVNHNQVRNNTFHFEWTFVSNSIQYSSWLWCAAVDRRTHNTEYWYSSQSALGCHRGKLSYSNHHTEMCAVMCNTCLEGVYLCKGKKNDFVSRWLHDRCLCDMLTVWHDKTRLQCPKITVR